MFAMTDPREAIAYFITWTTYATWLPGDQRGWAKKKVWGLQPPDPEQEALARSAVTEQPVILTKSQRDLIDQVIVKHCEIRGWQLRARNVRTNHVHIVVTAPGVEPKIIREQIKAWGSRRLSEQAGLVGGGKDGQRRWWTEGGDIELIWNKEQLQAVIHYVLEMQ
jgi:REP element-mobilizing transposase RayT